VDSPSRVPPREQFCFRVPRELYDAVNDAARADDTTQSLLLRTLIEEGMAARTQPSHSGRLLLRMPKTLHAALVAEAAREGISLNQLCVVKLATALTALLADSTREAHAR
jgi:predicted HicB family RNase H-like nuclease